MNFLANNPHSRQADHPFQILNYLPGGIRGAAFGLCAVPFDAENRTFLIAAVGLLSGGGFFLCSYALYLPPRF
jgi:hypothetical protein